MSNEAIVYEDRYLAFIDILGFERLVEKSRTDQSIATKLLEIIKDLKDGFAAQSGERAPTALLKRREVALFSDTVCISLPGDHDQSVAQLITDVAMLEFRLLYLGYTLRGAIARGPLKHKGNIIFGPCMNRAYKLESRLAIYPRVIIDPQERLPDAYAKLHYTRKDSDGLHYVNLFSPAIVIGVSHVSGQKTSDTAATMLAQIRELIGVAPDEAAEQKLRWLETCAIDALSVAPLTRSK